MNNIATKTLLATFTLALTLAGCNNMSKMAAAPAAPAPVAAVPAPAPAPAPVPVVAPAPAPKTFVLSDVNFEFNKATLTPEATKILNEVVKTLRDQPDVKYVLDGYTDNLGSPVYNKQLSERRAQAVRDFQINNGVPPGQLTIRAFGAANPVAPNDTRAGRAKNRRVEIRPAP